MTNDDVQRTLIQSLERVRKRFDAGADDWQFSLLRTFREYLNAIGVERRLADPVQAFLLQRTNEIMLERRRAAGRKGTPTPFGTTAALAYTAAAVTTLRIRHGRGLPDALTAVAKASGIERATIKEFRDNLSRGGKRVPAAAREAHDIFMAEMRDHQYSADQIIEAVTGIGKFVA